MRVCNPRAQSSKLLSPRQGAQQPGGSRAGAQPEVRKLGSVSSPAWRGRGHGRQVLLWAKWPFSGAFCLIAVMGAESLRVWCGKAQAARCVAAAQSAPSNWGGCTFAAESYKGSFPKSLVEELSVFVGFRILVFICCCGYFSSSKRRTLQECTAHSACSELAGSSLAPLLTCFTSSISVGKWNWQ